MRMDRPRDAVFDINRSAVEKRFEKTGIRSPLLLVMG
jgi:hypothetical protein